MKEGKMDKEHVKKMREEDVQIGDWISKCVDKGSFTSQDMLETLKRIKQAGYQLPPKLKVLDKETIERLSIAWEEEIIYSLEHPSGNAPAKWEDRLLNAQVDYNDKQLKTTRQVIEEYLEG